MVKTAEILPSEFQKRFSWLLICLIALAFGMIVIDSIGIEIGNMDLWKGMATHSLTALFAYLFGGIMRTNNVPAND